MTKLSEFELCFESFNKVLTSSVKIEKNTIYKVAEVTT